MNDILLNISNTLVGSSALKNIMQAAYLDPGSGSFILQLILASAAGILFAMRGYIQRFFSKFRRSDSDISEETDDQDDAE